MPSDTAGAARARPMPTDLDALDPGRRRLDLRPPRPARFALHLLERPIDAPHTNAAVDRARAIVGLGPNDPSAMMHACQWLARSIPRGIPWTDFPVSALPAYRVVRGSPLPVRRPSRPKDPPCPIEELAERVSHVVVHLPDGMPDPIAAEAPDLLCMAESVIDSLAPGVRVALVRCTEVVGGRDELRAMVGAQEPALRFLYSYAVNFDALAAPALERALAEPDRRAVAFVAETDVEIGQGHLVHALALAGVRKRRMPPFLGHPYALQALFDLRRRGKAPISGGVLDTRSTQWHADLVLGPSGLWAGTGKYAPVEIPRHLVSGIARSLSASLMLRRERRSIRLSRHGEAFLDAIHPDCMDLDLPMRWKDPPTDADREAMEAWIARRFRRMKTRVNAADAPPAS